MTRFILRRIGRAILTLWIVVTAAFVVLHLAGDPAETLLGPDAPAEAIRRFRIQYGLDAPLFTQYGLYLKQTLSGDLGTSMLYNRPVTELFMQRLPATLELASVALVIALLLGIPAGAFAALRRNSIWDRATMLAAFAGQSAPNFFIGILLIFFLSMRLGWLPSSGRGEPEQLVMPAITLATGWLAGLARMTRSSVLEVLHADYIRTARAKGLRESTVFNWHVLRNASLPIVTMFGLWLSGVIGGTAVTETVFAWPGVGRLVVEAVNRRDFPVVQTMILLIALCVVLVNLLVDIAYGWLDPRISVTGS